MTTNTKAAKPAKAATATAVAIVAKAPSARAIAIDTHNAAGFTGNAYTGISKPRNSGITKAPDTTTSKATARTHAQLTPRMLATLHELAKAYAAKPFPIVGIDRGQAAIFLASGFIVAGKDGNATLSADCLKRYHGKA